MTRIAPLAVALLLCLIPATAVHAQGPGGDLFGGFDGFDQFGKDQNDPNLKLKATYVVDPSGKRGRLDISATVGPGWCLYSTTQPKGGPIPAKLKVADSPAITAIGEFTPDHKPKIVPPDDIIRVPQEKFYGTVVWSAPFLLAEGSKPEDLGIKVELNGQSCHDKGTCFPVSAKAVAKFEGMQEVPADPSLQPAQVEPPMPAVAQPAGEYKILGKPGNYESDEAHGILSGKFTPTTVAPGGNVTVTLTFKPEEHFHIYAYEPTADAIGARPTQIAMSEKTPWLALQPKTDKPIIEEPQPNGFPAIRYHEGETTWTFTIQVPIEAETGKFPLVGYIGYQTCTKSMCDKPTGAMFEGIVEVGNRANDKSAPLAFSKASYSKASERAKVTHAAVQDVSRSGGNSEIKDESDIKWVVANPPETTSLGWVILFSFIGGAILNLMPCVLPVVGLKILSFVNQAGKHRAQVFMLNLIYSVGVISVFMILALVSTSLNMVVGYSVGQGTESEGLAWGEWSGDWRYILAMIVLVYTMGLSMLGVWELEMPSFLGRGSAANASNQSGYGGAFFKGIVTTLLSTPCSGPFLGPVFGYTISQPAYITFVVFGFIGLGMASPYLIIGINPRLIAFLPKPGNWMVAFKQAMGFVMMLTVVYLMYTLQEDYVVPTLTLLVGLGAGCWMLGQVHTMEHQSTKIATTIGALFLAVGVGWFSFTKLVETDTPINWDTYAEERWPTLEQDILAKQKAGQTVMVDFTADWCPTCQLNMHTAIDTKKVAQYVEDHNILPMKVDWTNSQHGNTTYVRGFLKKLGVKSIPLFAIFPGGEPTKVYVLPDLLTESKVIDSLDEVHKSASQAPKQTAMQD